MTRIVTGLGAVDRHPRAAQNSHLSRVCRSVQVDHPARCIFAVGPHAQRCIAGGDVAEDVIHEVRTPVCLSRQCSRRFRLELLLRLRSAESCSLSWAIRTATAALIDAPGRSLKLTSRFSFGCGSRTRCMQCTEPSRFALIIAPVGPPVSTARSIGGFRESIGGLCRFELQRIQLPAYSPRKYAANLSGRSVGRSHRKPYGFAYQHCGDPNRH